jgi:hypothetical protein
VSPHVDSHKALDAVSGVAIVASLAGWLPPVAALLGIVWYILQIYGWFEKRYSWKKSYRRRSTDLLGQ